MRRVHKVEYNPSVEPDEEVSPPPPELPLEELKIPQAKRERTVAKKDKESLFDLLLALPWIAICLLLGFKAVFDPYFIPGITNSDIFQMYAYIFGHLGNTGAMVILIMTIFVIAFAGLLIYKSFWRLAFPDLSIRQYGVEEINVRSNDGTEKKEKRSIYTPSSKEGRIYFTIGRGFWDSWYRKRHGLAQPSTITLYVKRRFSIPNPFRPLASCDKVIITDPEFNRFEKDGMFKRVVRASSWIRSHQNNHLIYMLVEDPYAHIDFDTKSYDTMSNDILDNAIPEVTKSSAVNPDIQQDQMRNNMFYMPEDSIRRDINLSEMKKKILTRLNK